jgi:hypothetical protein
MITKIIETAAAKIGRSMKKCRIALDDDDPVLGRIPPAFPLRLV